MSLGVPDMQLGFTATDTLDGAPIEVPVTEVESRQEKSTRQCLIELAFGDLRPGTHTLTLVARDTSGTEANKTTLAFSVK